MNHIKKNLAFYIPIAIILIIIGFFLWSSLQNMFKQNSQPKKPLMGQAVPVLSRDHVPDETKVTYNSNPPSSGKHYADPQDAGIYSTSPADGHLVHSLEHGAIILWYNPKLVTQRQVTELKSIFKNISLEKTIMTPRNSLDVPVALSSWGRILKHKTVDETQIRTFFDTNYDRGPEQAPI